MPPEAPGPPKPPKPPFLRRRWVRATARWAVAAALFAGSAAGAAKLITDRERTDVPGLATEHDGRWDYPQLALPSLPDGSAAPFTDGNPHGIHHVDLRALLLPAPQLSAAHESLPLGAGKGAEDGEWVGAEMFVNAFAEEDRERLTTALDATTLRHVAARGWVMPDGTGTEIYLVRFSTPAIAEGFVLNELGRLGNRAGLDGAQSVVIDDAWPKEANKLGPVRVTVKRELPGSPDGQSRAAFLWSGDTIGLVVQRNPDDVAEVPFHQTVILQAQLLG
jgi:hypothetical protein